MQGEWGEVWGSYLALLQPLLPKNPLGCRLWEGEVVEHGRRLRTSAACKRSSPGDPKADSVPPYLFGLPRTRACRQGQSLGGIGRGAGGEAAPAALSCCPAPRIAPLSPLPRRRNRQGGTGRSTRTALQGPTWISLKAVPPYQCATGAEPVRSQSIWEEAVGRRCLPK